MNGNPLPYVIVWDDPNNRGSRWWLDHTAWRSTPAFAQKFTTYEEANRRLAELFNKDHIYVERIRE